MTDDDNIIEIDAADVEIIAPDDEVGQETGMVDVKTAVPIHLHLALKAEAERNGRSLRSEMRIALTEHVRRQAVARGRRS